MRRIGLAVVQNLTLKGQHPLRYVYFEDPDGNMLELVASTVDGWPAKFLR